MTRRGEMWHYRRPGFEALLLAELQRQQRCNQLCDIVLRAEGMSVPAHSCVLSALSPQLSCALSSAPPPPSGQRRLLDFQAVKACVLLRLVGLLYSGEMTGEGEAERQEVISAAARLGIHDLVEVGKRDGKGGREEEETPQREVGVQTEPSQLRREQREWRREERDGSTLLWRETPSNGERDAGTQTGEFETNTALLPHPLASFQTVDISAIQNSGATVSSGTTDPQFLPHHIPYVPLSLLYPPDGSQASAHLPPPPSSIFIPPTVECFAAGQEPVYVLPQSSSLIPSSVPSSQVTEGPAPFAFDPQNLGAEPPGAVEVGEQFEQFEGNISGFISHFFNPDQEEAAPRGRRRGRRRGGGAGGARRAGTGERRARRPRGRRGGGGGRGRQRGKKTAEVMEEVAAVSTPKKDWRRRWGVHVSRRGIGGGVVGRKLFLKTRELLQPIKIYLKRRGRGEAWEVFRVGDERGGATTGQDRRRSRGQQSSTQLTQDDLPVAKRQTESGKSLPFHPLPVQLYKTQIFEPPSNPPTLSSSSEPSPPPPSLPTPPPPYISPAPALLHTTRLPPLGPLPPEVEQFEQLLEDIMMGLDILPNNNNSNSNNNNSNNSTTSPHPHLHPNSSNSGNYPSSKKTFIQLQQQQQQQQQQHSFTSGYQEAVGKGIPITMAPVSVGTVSVATGVNSSFSKCEVPALHQQQGEGELSDILDHFLWTFEQHVAGCSTKARPEMCSQSYMQPNSGATATTDSQTQPYPCLREQTETQIQTGSAVPRVEESTVHRSHQGHTGSPHPVQTVVSSAHIHCPVTNTPPLSPSLSPLQNTLRLAAALPSVRAVLPHCPDVTERERDEEQKRILTRRQRRDRTGTPVQASAAKLTEQPEREKAYAKKPPNHTQPSKLSTPGAATLASDTAVTISCKQPKAPSRVRSRPGRTPAKRGKLYSGRKQVRVRAGCPGTGDAKTTSVCERGGRTEPEFKGQTVEVKTPPSAECPIRSLLDYNSPNKQILPRISYPIRSRLSDHHIQSTPFAEEESPSRKHPLPDSRPTSTLEEVQAYPPQPIKLKRGPGRPRKGRPHLAPSGGESLKVTTSTTLTQPTEQHCREEQDRPEEEEEEKRVLLAEAGEPVRTGEKRGIEETEEESRTDAAKRVCLEQVGLKPTTSKPHTSSSKPQSNVLEPQSSTQDVEEESEEEEDVVVTLESEDEVELVSTSLPANEKSQDVWQTLTSEGGGEMERGREREQKEEGRKWEMDEDTERGVSSGEDVVVMDSDSDESIDVVGDGDDDPREWMGREERYTHLQSPSAGERKTPTLLYLAVKKPPALQPSRSTIEVNLGSTGSWDEDEVDGEEEVDVIGGSNPSTDPLPCNWGEWLKAELEEEENEEEEIDVVGGEMG